MLSAHLRDTEIELMLTSSEPGKDSKENGVISRSATPIPSRPTTPKPLNGSDQFRSGLLTIRIFSGLYFYVAHPLSFLVRFRKRIVPHSRSAGSRSYPTCTWISRTPKVHDQPRQRATQTVLVASICRTRVRQERDSYRCSGRRSL